MPGAFTGPLSPGALSFSPAVLVAFYFYLRLLKFNPPAGFIGGLLFLVSPPVLLAYKYPVYTREDPLAYLLVVVGLIAIFKSKAFLVSLISVAAAWTRETTLIVPLAYLLAAEESWRKRIFWFALPVLALVGLRFYWGVEFGNSLESGMNNARFPFETLAFLFCAFGALWLPYGVRLSELWRRGDFPTYGWKILTASGPIVFVLVVVATLTISRARENRIIFILFPWAIPFALDWFRSNQSTLKAAVRDYSYWVISFSILALISAGVLFFRVTNPEGMRYLLADFVNGYWLFLGAVHLSVTLPFSCHGSGVP